MTPLWNTICYTFLFSVEAFTLLNYGYDDFIYPLCIFRNIHFKRTSICPVSCFFTLKSCELVVCKVVVASSVRVLTYSHHLANSPGCAEEKCLFSSPMVIHMLNTCFCVHERVYVPVLLPIAYGSHTDLSHVFFCAFRSSWLALST